MTGITIVFNIRYSNLKYVCYNNIQIILTQYKNILLGYLYYKFIIIYNKIKL